MNLENLFLTAIRSLAKNKLRSALTSLGIIIGVASVIMMVGIGNSARIAVREKIFTYGSNAMSVTSVPSSFSTPFNDGDLTKIKKTIPLVKHITPVSANMITLVGYRNKYTECKIYGVNNEFFMIKEWPLQYGRYFEESELFSNEKVAIIGNTTREELFGDVNPSGSVILVSLQPFKVIGSLSEMGQALSGRDQDNVIIVPYTTAQFRLTGKGTFDELFISTYTEDAMEEAVGEIKRYFIREHGLKPQGPYDFKIKTSRDLLDMAEFMSRTLTMLLAGIASISLIVGGIGIMNIMLVSVSERTREIGIRMAIGARKKDILYQFLIESVTLTSAGGIIGISLGLIVYFIITFFADWPFVLSTLSIFTAFLFSCAVGIIFGAYPARKASSLNPIEALRFE